MSANAHIALTLAAGFGPWLLACALNRPFRRLVIWVDPFISETAMDGLFVLGVVATTFLALAVVGA